MAIVAKRGFTEEEAAAYIAMSRSFLRQSRMNGDLEGRVPGPRFIKVGSRAIRYLREDLDMWLETFAKC
jgi:predicted DNA-binding transcriptional regulator AlpA